MKLPQIANKLASAGDASAGVTSAGSGQVKKEIDAVPPSPHVQPPHPLLSPLRMGDHILTVAADIR